MTEPETINIGDCSLCKKECTVISINDTPLGCKHQYCKDCIKSILSINAIKKCPIRECEHIITPNILEKIMKTDSFNNLPLVDETILETLSRISVFSKIYTGRLTPFMTLPIPDDLEFIGPFGKISVATNFVKVASPEAAFNFINTQPPNLGDQTPTRIFIHHENVYYAMKQDGPIVPFISHVGLIGRCPSCYTQMFFKRDALTSCGNCRKNICVCCGLEDCTKPKLSNEEIIHGIRSQLHLPHNIPKITFLGMSFNLPYVVKNITWMYTTFNEETQIMKLISAKIHLATFNGKKIHELTLEDRQKVFTQLKNYEIKTFYNYQFKGLHSKYFDILIKNELSKIIKENQQQLQTNKSTVTPTEPARKASRIPIPSPPIMTENVPQAFHKPVFDNSGIDALLAAAQTIKDQEPPAKKKRAALTKPPSLITPAHAASRQITFALSFSKLPGMPPFVYHNIDNPNQFERNEMYREQITVANAYIDMAIKLITANG